LEASLVYKVSSRTARATQRNPVSKNKTKQKTKKKQQKKRNTLSVADHCFSLHNYLMLHLIVSLCGLATKKFPTLESLLGGYYREMEYIF
jgi:ribosomal protein L32